MIARRHEPSRIPVRGAVGLGMTAASLAMLLSLRAPGTTEAQFSLLATDPSTGTSSSDGVTALAFASPSASAAPSRGPAVDPSASRTSRSVSPTTAATATTAASVTLVGDPVSFRFGTVQVQVTVENGVITSVQALQLPDGDRHSVQISQQVEPLLADEALAAQSARIDTISGATYTSRAYAQSLQSALDQLAA